MKRILTLVVVALSILVSSTALAKPLRAPIKLDTVKLEKAKAKVVKPRIKLKPGALEAAMKKSKATKAPKVTKPTKVTKVKPRIRIPLPKAR